MLRLPADARRLLEVVAVAGRPLRQADAWQAAELGGEERPALAVLRSGRLIRSTGPPEQDEIETYHDRVRETVVLHLAPAALRQRHHGLARALESSGQADPENLALHFEGAGEPEKAGAYYAVAAAKAAEALAFERAVQFYRMAVHLRPGAGAEARALRRQLGEALANDGHGAEAAREYVGAAVGAPAGEGLELRRRAAEQYLISGHVDDGLAVLDVVLRAVGWRLAPTPRRALLALLTRRARLWLRGLRFRECPADQLSAGELTRLDICWSVTRGLSAADVIRGADFQTRNLLLSLDAGEPYRVARALALEAAHVAGAGAPTRQRTAKLLDSAAALAQRIEDPHALGLVSLAAGMAAYLEGRWQRALERARHAESLFRDHCTGVWWELDTVQAIGLYSQFFLGEIAELVQRMPVIRKEARERGDLYALGNLNEVMAMAQLAADDPGAARRTVDEIRGQRSPHGFHFQHLNGLSAQIHLDLYSGQGQAAWERITQCWPTIVGSLLLRVQFFRITQRHLRARSALAAARSSVDARPFLRAAARDARSLEREDMPYAAALASLLRAGIAAAQGETALAVVRLADAERAFDQLDMHLHAAAARRRRGELIGGGEGSSPVAQTDSWMKHQHIQNPSRMTVMLAPGFPD